MIEKKKYFRKGVLSLKEISAGGVVYVKDNGAIHIMLIEDRYGRWSLPKGKQEQGETLPETALREVREETGIIGTIVAPIETIYYTYNHPTIGHIQKEVHYYLVEKIAGEVAVQIEEIRSVHWFEPLRAWDIQSRSGYDNNDIVLQKALELLHIHPTKES